MSENMGGPVGTKPAVKKKRRWPLVVGFAAVFIFGTFLGGCGKGETKTADPVVKTETVTKTVEVEKVPAACVKALGHADTGLGLASESMGYVSDAFHAIARLDTAAVQEANDSMGAVTAEVKRLGPLYSAERDTCLKAANK